MTRIPFADAQIGQDRITGLLLAGGVVGSVLFVAVLLVEGATRPGYDGWVQAGSALSLSGWGWIALLAIRYLPQTRPSASTVLAQRPDHKRPQREDEAS
jgi:hypothetical protein